MKNLQTYEEFLNESIQYKTLDDPRLKTADIHNWIVGKSYDVGKKFPATRAKTREEKLEIIRNPEFQAAYTLYHQQYFDNLLDQWKGVCNGNLPSRNVNKETSKEKRDEIFDALEEWITRENGILTTIKDLGFETFAANEISGIYHKIPLKQKRIY